jgi:hypothetical protein
VLSGVVEDELAGVVEVLPVVWCGADARGAESALMVEGSTANNLKVLVELVDEVTVGVARCKGGWEIESLKIDGTELQFSGGETTEFSVRTGAEGMVNQRENSVRGPPMLKSFIVDQSTEVTKEYGIDVFRTITLVAPNE